MPETVPNRDDWFHEELGDLVSSFLGPGEWEPQPPIWKQLPQGGQSDGDFPPELEEKPY